jgi:hypothetical protein
MNLRFFKGFNSKNWMKIKLMNGLVQLTHQIQRTWTFTQNCDGLIFLGTKIVVKLLKFGELFFGIIHQLWLKTKIQDSFSIIPSGR